MKSKDIKILLVDDEPDVIEIIRYNLDKEGYTLMTASDGKEALKKVKKDVPHLVIMDVMMPKMDGIEACEQMRSLKQESHSRCQEKSLNYFTYLLQNRTKLLKDQKLWKSFGEAR